MEVSAVGKAIAIGPQAPAPVWPCCDHSIIYVHQAPPVTDAA